jgi:hypothetical protein
VNKKCTIVMVMIGCVLDASVIAVPMEKDTPGTESAWARVERVGPPNQNFIDVERYRFGTTDMSKLDFYPVPQDKVTRDTYMRAIDASNPRTLAAKPDRGEQGPVMFLPVLAKYVQTRDPFWGEAIMAMLKHYHVSLQKCVAQRKWFWDFEWPVTAIPLYRKHLIAGGLLQENDAWFRDMWLYYCRHLHVWDSEETEWRGGCHRSMPEGLSKGLAAQWYPDIPEAAHWKQYGELNFRDFWRSKDVPQNDTGYMMGPFVALMCNSDQFLGDDRFYLDPGMKRLWDRLLVEITPDGAINPYGPNGGYNATADYRVFMLERLAAKTGDGRYRYGAHKLMNYLRYQSRSSQADTYATSMRCLALAWLFADDSVKPIEPASGSLWNTRVEAIRVPHRDAQLTERLLGNADPDPTKGIICCSWYMTDQLWPDKIVLRSGWRPGDFFALVELHPTSFPANPGGIMGLNRFGAPFTQIVTSKGSSQENRVLVEDLDATVMRRYHPDRLRIDENWRSGTMPDIRSEVSYFEDTPEATYAQVRVLNMDGLPVRYEREFVFVKNRFLATREIVTFEECFRARVAALWNTQNTGPQIGTHWANTFLSAPVGDNGRTMMKSPPVDLLVWFAPQKDCRLQVVDRFMLDPRAADCPAQLRYTWEGTPERGQQLVFTQVYYPHAPYRARASTNNPGAVPVYGDQLQATAGAAGITVLRDDKDLSVLRLEFDKGRVEYVVFNPDQQSVKLDSATTEKAYAYIDGGKMP